MPDIEVRIAGKAVVTGDDLTEGPDVVAHCDLCDQDADLVAALVQGLYACRDCLRARLDAGSVATWRAKEPSDKGLPWGQIAG